MDTNWAAEHLQVIRTLMERSAVYRRALAPIMLVSGIVGTAAAAIPHFKPIQSAHDFSLFWLIVSLVAVVAAFLLVRRQALKEAEAFWSPPTRRVSQALLPAFLLGLVAGAFYLLEGNRLNASPSLLAIFWTAVYGCALHAAGFFMQRGIKLFAWVFLLGSAVLLLAYPAVPRLQTPESAHYIMGTFFGILHFAYGVYLYFSEKTRNAA
ncbi:MAG: hypothetical protein JWM16_5920 [Verrucomicrobiales bacterium]|nr:hypothetical protein [Verrucomicrobiales bacterium]